MAPAGAEEQAAPETANAQRSSKQEASQRHIKQVKLGRPAALEASCSAAGGKQAPNQAASPVAASQVPPSSVPQTMAKTTTLQRAQQTCAPAKLGAFNFSHGLQMLKTGRACAVAPGTQSAPGAPAARGMRQPVPRVAPIQAPGQNAEHASAAPRGLPSRSSAILHQQQPREAEHRAPLSPPSSQQLQPLQDSQHSMSSMATFWPQQAPPPSQQQKSPRRSPGKENSAPGQRNSAGTGRSTAQRYGTAGQGMQAAKNARGPTMQEQQGGADPVQGLLRTLGQLAHLSQLQRLGDTAQRAHLPGLQLPIAPLQCGAMPPSLHTSLLQLSQVTLAVHGC